MINNNTKITDFYQWQSNILLMRPISLAFPPIQLDSVDSTNRYAAGLLRHSEVAEGTVILAEEQTKGRGQGTHTWHSEKGMNLLFSIILKPVFLEAHRQFYLSMAVADSLFDNLHRQGFSTSVKWPNDILIKGKKTAGILIENTILSQNLHTSIIGIGLNVNQEIFDPGIPNPTSLKLEGGKTYNILNLLETMLKDLEKWFNALYAGEYGRIKSHYLNALWLLNTRAVFTDASGIYEGRIADVSESGELVVKPTGGEVRTYGFKEVEVSP